MHFIVIGLEFHNYSQSVVDAIRALGHEAEFFPIVDYYSNCTYISRKLYKCGCKFLKKRWFEKWEAECVDFCEKHYKENSKIIILNGMLVSSTLLEKLGGYQKILCCWDSIKCYPNDIDNCLQFYEKIYVFEYSDIDYLLSSYGIEAEYLPVGCDCNIFFPIEEKEKDIDICFIGGKRNNRLDVLKNVAKLAFDNNLKMYVGGGNWYNKKYFWKKQKFRKLYSHLFDYIDIRNVPPCEVAEIYRRSKICLNINVAEHKSINPRTFEILATKSFQIMNSGQDYHGMIAPGDDIVEYDSIDDLKEKILFYLQREDLRTAVAEHGYETVCNSYSMKALMKKVIQSEELL